MSFPSSPSLDFERSVLRFDLADPVAGRIARGVCRVYVVWPSRLFDAEERDPRAVMARHVAWRLTYLLTDLSVENIAELSGMTVGTVGRWARSWQPFAERYGDLLKDGDTFWQRHAELVLGPLCDALGLPFDEWPADLRVREFPATAVPA